MPAITSLSFDNTFARLPPDFYEVIDPAPLAEPSLVALNADAAMLIDLDLNATAPAELAAYFAGNRRIPGAEPIAMLYAGHQFGVWVSQLGDGRAFLLGEVRNQRGEKWDLHLKGGGATRFARGGDGRSVLRSAIREYLACEALHGLGIPTTRALAVVGSSERVRREVPERAATLLRLASSHVRFGTFEAFAARERSDLVRILADFVIHEHYPGCEGRYGAWLHEVVVRTAGLVAEWQAVGFAHGVMNTDNMSIVGETLDYGPFSFLDDFDPAHVGNHSDLEGRYAFDQQPAVALWNLERLAEALASLVSAEESRAALEAFAPAFEERIGRRVRAKLGLMTAREHDSVLARDLFRLLRAERADYTRFFRALCFFDTGEQPHAALRAQVRDQAAFDAWLERYRARLLEEGSRKEERRARMARVNPAYVLRTWLAERAIRRAVDEGDFAEIERLRLLLRFPYAELPGCEEYAASPPEWARDLVVSCSS
jgi:serine/tyrosine/threonine adenylyltransferase